ncbi:MAG: response regulator [Desulfobacterales bacterium]|jgi:two-component system cell cycle sensor histidine kinase/response regulator CckA
MTPTASLPKHTIRNGLQNGVAAEANDNRLESFFNSMVLIGVFIAIIYVALDTILHIFYSARFNLIASAVGEDLYEIYIRIIVLCLFAIFGSHAQYTINNLKKKEKELVTYRNHLEELVHIRTSALLATNQKLRDEIAVRERSEQALRESEEKYRLLVENANDAIFIIQDDKVTFPNPKAHQLSSEMNVDIDRQPFFDFVHPEDKDRVINWYERRLKSRDVPSTCTFKLIDRFGKEHWIELNAVLIYWEKKIAALNFLKDITAQKIMEFQFRQSQRMESIGTLAGGIAHDFNNLLMGIQGNTSVMLLDIDPDHSLYENLKSIQRCVKSGANLTRQLLGFARGGKYVVKPTHINEVIDRTAHIFGRSRKDINFHRRYNKNIWMVNVDVGQIEQVLLNLYVNAWQAMPNGGDLYLETDNIRLDKVYIDTKPFSVKPGRYVKISVTDTGIGMDKKIQQRIFEPFFTTKEVGQGTGLGLASAYGIIKNHGGFITCYSEVEVGSTFNIYLPAHAKKGTQTEKVVEEALGGNETILLVDDEKMIIEVGRKMMESLGYLVVAAGKGEEALTLYRKRYDHIDLIILDMIMPYMGGKDVFNRIKEINPKAKVLLSSGYSLNGQAQEIMAQGCNGFIQKPFDMVELSRKIREILDSPNG